MKKDIKHKVTYRNSHWLRKKREKNTKKNLIETDCKIKCPVRKKYFPVLLN